MQIVLHPMDKGTERQGRLEKEACEEEKVRVLTLKVDISSWCRSATVAEGIFSKKVAVAVVSAVEVEELHGQCAHKSSNFRLDVFLPLSDDLRRRRLR